MRPSQLFAAVLAMSSVAAATPDAFGGINALDVRNLLFGRADNDNTQSTSAAPKSTATSDEASSTAAPKSTDKASTTDKNNDDEASSTAKATGSGKASGSGTKTTRKSKSTAYDARLPAGGLTMVTPSALAGSQYYKVGDWVTFAWNYTSLSVTPTALDILATCTANQATYTIAVNHSAEQTSVLWDTGSPPDGQAPFLTEKYTLLIYDAASSVSATAAAGYFGPFSGLSFGMYTPQPYVGIDNYTCPNCNSAFSHFEKMTFKALMLTTGTTFASLLYFSHNFGLL